MRFVPKMWIVVGEYHKNIYDACLILVQACFLLCQVQAQAMIWAKLIRLIPNRKQILSCFVFSNLKIDHICVIYTKREKAYLNYSESAKKG